ncbi:parvulin peptidyl-prolyl isomerase [Prauserella flavalba]|uniref:Parvulin peptidyl-prolyl isomerase n=1 Tax=Prauserella flavalba TaxID=1477506 RepID=A0A318LFC0_9PSEU|nr:parvulin peptidyl-prolyl isomerase [Prauserella flavalba]
MGGRLRVPRTKRARALLAVVLVLLLGGGTAGYFWWKSGELPDGVAFRVGDKMVTVDDVNKEMDTLRALYGVQRPTDANALDRYWRDGAKAQAVSIVLDDAARAQNITIADKTARDVLSRYIAQQIGEGPSARDEFVRALGNAGTSEQAVLTEIKRQLALNQLFDQVTAGQTVTDEEVRQAFDQRRAQLGTPERRHLRNIVVRTKEEADQVLADIRGGSTFEDVAARTSLDSTRTAGGDLGELSSDQLDESYRGPAFSARPGTVFGPVQNEHGWNVGKVEQVLPPIPAEFEQVKGRLKDTLLLEKSLRVWRDWLAEQIKRADVQYADRYLPADPDAPPGDDSIPGNAPAPAGPPR